MLKSCPANVVPAILYTVEPPTKDPPSHKGHFVMSQKSSYSHILKPPRRGESLYNGPNGWSQGVLDLEVPLYITSMAISDLF